MDYRPGLVAVACTRPKEPRAAWSEVDASDPPGSDRDRDGVTDDRAVTA